VEIFLGIMSYFELWFFGSSRFGTRDVCRVTRKTRETRSLLDPVPDPNEIFSHPGTS